MFSRNKKGPTPSIINPQELDLKLNLNLSPPRRPARSPPAGVVVGPRRTSPEVSPPRSCVSSEDNMNYSSSPEATSMVLAACPRCFMYVMLPASDTRCHKCNTPVILDFLGDNNRHHHDGGDN